MKINNFLFLFLFVFISHAQINLNPKILNITRTEKAPKIDGVLDENFWQNSEVAKNFVMFRPGFGDKEHPNKKTEVKVAYDNEAIYFGAYLFDDDIKNIALESSTRDNFGQVDWFGIMINPLNDGLNDTEFFIQATGNQADAKATVDSEDFSWSGVWESAVKIDADKWVVEVKIPYSALRFSNNKEQIWGLNFHRRIQNTKEQFVWNPIDKTKGYIQQYAGILKGFKNIKPPVRLSFSPYASANYSIFDSDKKFDTSFGMDVKYGISESFTLDATLIPDFGQTAFDNLILNLSPFEQEYSEKRAFFTEGTELFSKGDLFYSRRVGNSPSTYINTNEDLNSNEEILNEPSNVKMLNAVKVSGRTKNGLGIGVFNAITEKTEATIKNTNTNELRKIITEPFANYSVIVLDKQFNKNSSISFVNTNVLREGKFRDANVSALLFDLTNKSNKFKIEGGSSFSYLNEFDKTTKGISTEIALRKISGNWQYGIEHSLQDENFNKNDLGFQQRNNFSNFESYLTYEIFEPTKNFDSYRFAFWADINYLHKPNTYTDNEIGVNYYFQTKKGRLDFGGYFETSLGNQYDYYEPRVEGRYFKKSPRIASNNWISTDYRKKFAIDLQVYISKRTQNDNYYISSSISPRFRINDKLSFIHELSYSKDSNDYGYVNELENGDIIFGKRDTKSITNSLSGKYNFSTKSALNLTFRHYWSPVEYNTQFYLLNNEGVLVENNYSSNHNINYNIWNFDLNYTWEFAPGSQLIALYRNSIFNEDQLSNLSFSENLDNLFDESILHNLSVRFVYYIDYNKAKNWL
ncbi:DUF5916 domain-containing protein [Lutibacter sp. TH_r2]|uniref:DUF5916 domain-containing protein n=1 Tax=Lutibacter sp. TH_r2 TaxID=3082083 RepID=UPI002954E92F|nr:DUF5916 domain-containing protein [Lutibacter sp. TH_r2]MDV7188123.1 DUF5916 domain-containing protein [Lutibacter sp. TH_r2]